ncbi:PAS domain S-box-containing protein [Halopenitus malekzadehii]|uniref:PAS domain S-box-containing protein n=1 Tax=Halopenitus malekzadehii TaxID=1267564 RepID=A0A1H6JG53_9EURY|nr:PAS domain S-box protein [Halopenitus malekzadehii]SEH59368.1 PAS domain S-box-containing protein [Halopenitus malekzadehii]
MTDDDPRNGSALDGLPERPPRRSGDAGMSADPPPLFGLAAERSGLDPTDGDRRPRIGCCLSRGGHEQLLADWLEEHGYDPVRVDPEAIDAVRFDLCIVDRRTLGDVRDPILERHSRSQSLLPVLLLTPGDTGETLAALPAPLAAVVTDVVSIPLRTPILKRRLESALRTRRLSRDLAGSRERYRQLVEHTPAAVFLVHDGRITYANAAAERLLGADGGLRGEPFARFVASADRDRVLDLIGAMSPGGSIEFVDVDFRRNDYTIPTELAVARVDDEDATWPAGIGQFSGRTVQIVAHDVSRRQAREDQLKLYRRAMETATVGISITNPSLSGNPLIYVNDEFERITGRSQEEVLGRNPRFLQTEHTDPDTVARIRAAIEAGEPISVEIRNGRTDGTEWYNQLDITPIEGSDGEVEYFLGFQRDVTDRHEREQRLAVLDRVLRHDLRNRLNVVTGHAAEIEGGNGDAVEHAAAIRNAAESLMELSDAARRFRSAMREDAPLERVRLDSLLVDLLETVAETDPAVTLHSDLSPAMVRSNGGLQLAIEEVLTNAITHADRDPEIGITLRVDGNEAVLRIADNGPGIPATERNALEGTAETPTDHGSGLGLWLVRWAVTDVDGEVSYAANDPRGAVITLRLPIVEDLHPDSEPNGS